MALKRIEDLDPASTPLAGTELVELQQGTDSVQCTTQDIADLASGLSNPMTTEGDIIVADTGGTPLRLPAGTEGHVLTIVSGAPAYAAAPGGAPDWGDIGGTLSAQTDLQSALDAKAGNAYAIVTEASPFVANPGTHDGLSRYIRAGGDVTFDDAEPYTAGMVFNIRATGSISLVEDGVTLTPPSGGTLALTAGMAVQVVMTGATAGDVIGQTVATP